MMRSAQGKASKTISCRPVKSGGSAMQASNTPPHHPPGVAFPTWNPAGKVERKSNRFESRMNFSASGIPGGAFFMHFCAFGLLPKFNTRCNVNLIFAKSLFSEICTQKAHFAQLGPSWGASAGPEGAAVRVRRFTPGDLFQEMVFGGGIIIRV